MSEFLLALDDVLYYPILIIVLLAAGLYFTFTTGFVQFRWLRQSIRVIMEKPEKEGSISSFQALMVSTASRVGTGNIIGISTALCLGGFGSVFWMWAIAMIGSATAFIESTLAQVYKRKDANGDSYGGPAYYIETALHNKTLAIAFAIALIVTYAGGFNLLASYNLQSTFSVYGFYDKATTPWIIGGLLAVMVGYCVMGGGKRIVHVTGTLVPIMGVLYVLLSLAIILMHLDMIPSVLGAVFADAFNFQKILGGISASCLMFGIKRGLYSNEAGVGSAPNAAAAADVSHPAQQGLVQMLSVVIDTILCTCTALICMFSGIIPTKEMAGAPYVQAATQVDFGAFGPIMITFAMVLFAFTTLLGNLFLCRQLPSLPEWRQDSLQIYYDHLPHHRRHRHLRRRRDEHGQRMGPRRYHDGLYVFDEHPLYHGHEQNGHCRHERLWPSACRRQKTSFQGKKYWSRRLQS